MKKYILEFIVSFIFQVIMLPVVILLYRTGLFFNFGGDKGEILSGMFLALPLGSLIGIIIINRFYYKAFSWNLLNIIAPMTMALSGVILFVLLMDMRGGYVALLSLLIVPIMTTIGYELAQSFRKANNEGNPH